MSIYSCCLKAMFLRCSPSKPDVKLVIGVWKEFHRLGGLDLPEVDL